MPFQSEKQRRYLWANEPEIARDWTDTYGSRIRRDNGGIMDMASDGNLIHDFQNYTNGGGNVSVPTSFQARAGSEPVDLAYVTPREQGILQNLKPGTPHEGPMGIPNYDDFDAAGNYRSGAAMSAAETGGGQTERDRADLRAAGISPTEAADIRSGAVAAGARGTPQEQRAAQKTFPGLGLARSGARGLGNWASQFAGSKIGGGLGSMLLGPWGALLGALFGRGVGKRAYGAYQTKDKKESLQDILLGQNTLLSNVFNKKINEPPRGEGIAGIPWWLRKRMG